MPEKIIALPPVGQDFVPECLPSVFRITVLGHRPLDARTTECTANLYHERANLNVIALCR